MNSQSMSIGVLTPLQGYINWLNYNGYSSKLRKRMVG